MLLYLTLRKFQKIQKIEIVCGGHRPAHSRDGPAASLSMVSSIVWSLIYCKSDHGVDFGGKLKVIADWLSQSVAPAQSNHV